MAPSFSRRFLFILFVLLSPLTLYGAPAADLGPQSSTATGGQRVLVAAVRFPNAEPEKTLKDLQQRAVSRLDAYLREQSYGLTWMEADFRGWVALPDELSKYTLSPYNFKVDRRRVRKIIEDTMSDLENSVDFANYRHMLIIPGVHTMPGKGYGMLCYCANPGMLSGVSKRSVPRFETLRSKGGKEFSGGIFVGAENAHLGMFAHDFLHALGGVRDNQRLVP